MTAFTRAQHYCHSPPPSTPPPCTPPPPAASPSPPNCSLAGAAIMGESPPKESSPASAGVRGVSAPPLLPVDAPLPLPTKRTRHTEVAGKKPQKCSWKGVTVPLLGGMEAVSTESAVRVHSCARRRVNAFAAGARAKSKSHPRRRRLSSASCARRAWRWPPALPVSTEKRRGHLHAFDCGARRHLRFDRFAKRHQVLSRTASLQGHSARARCKGSAARGMAAANLNLHALFFAFFLDSRDFNAARK